MTLRVGLIVNPISGIGGEAGYKGSDADWRKALDAGFEPHAGERASRFVESLHDADVAWLSAAGAMGVAGLPTIEATAKAIGETTPEDTAAAAEAMRAAGVDLICFVGGDGTATDVARTIGTTVPCLGVPAGVKITSPVFAHDLEEAAWLVSHLAPGFETIARDVTDLDEEAYRAGRLDTRLTGSLLVPASPMVQGGKIATVADTPLDGMVTHLMRDWDTAALTIVGAGSVCRAIKKGFWGEPTLLGVDVIAGDRIIAADVDAPTLEALVAEAAVEGRPVRIVVTLIGGQGVAFGRGTQVITPRVLRAAGWDHVHIVAPPEKLLGLRGIIIDTGDPALDASAPKYIRVISGHNETRMVRVNPPPKESS